VLILQNQVSAEVGSLINMSALAVSQLLESAQEKGIELNLETSAVENQVQTVHQKSDQCPVSLNDIKFNSGFIRCRR
jgi:hypothetical protein